MFNRNERKLSLFPFRVKRKTEKVQIPLTNSSFPFRCEMFVLQCSNRYERRTFSNCFLIILFVEQLEKRKEKIFEFSLN